MGLRLFTSDGSPLFCRGVIVAIFHLAGNSSSLKDLFIRNVSCGINARKLCFKISVDILETADALVTSIASQILTVAISGTILLVRKIG